MQSPAMALETAAFIAGVPDTIIVRMHGGRGVSSTPMAPPLASVSAGAASRKPEDPATPAPPAPKERFLGKALISRPLQTALFGIPSGLQKVDIFKRRSQGRSPLPSYAAIADVSRALTGDVGKRRLELSAASYVRIFKWCEPSRSGPQFVALPGQREGASARQPSIRRTRSRQPRCCCRAKHSRMVGPLANSRYLEFSAVWCPPCRHLEGDLRRLASENHDVAVRSVDVDRNPELIASLQEGSLHLPVVV